MRPEILGEVESADVALLFTIYLLVVVALPLTLGLAITYRGLTRDCRCALCGNDTLRIHTRVTRALQSLWRQTALQRRWCPLCHWEGYARVKPQPVLAVRNPATQRPTRGCRTDPLRTLRVGGTQWRVLLQTWQDHGWHYGRLLFVGPAGRLWRDPVESFAGPSRNDVVDQALSLSDGLLSYRIRELVSD